MRKNDGIVGVLFGESVGRQIGSTWFWAMECMVLISMIRINWYLATVNTQLVYYTGEVQLADKLTDAFIFLLPIGGIISIPGIGWLLDTRPMQDVIIVLAIMPAAFGILTLTSSVIPQLIGIGFLVVYRPLFYTAISDYAAKVFGFETFGTVYGLAMTLSGLFGLILTPLDILTKGPLGGDYTPVNVTMLVLGVITAIGLFIRVWSYTRSGQVRLPEGPDSEVIQEEDEEEA